jgi:hypothetical protein
LDSVNGVKSRLWRAHRQVNAVFDEIIDGCEAMREKKQKETATATETAGGDDLLSVMLRIMKERSLCSLSERRTSRPKLDYSPSLGEKWC